MQNRIDIDKGVAIRSHPQFGVDIYMYIDEPGVYLTAHGTPVSEAMAKAAGFDVLKDGKEKLKRERMQLAKDAIEAEIDGAQVVKETVEEKNGFRLVHIGQGRHNVEDLDGNVLHKGALTKELGTKLFGQLTESVKVKEEK